MKRLSMLLLCMLLLLTAYAQSTKERLDRGTVAVQTPEGVFVGWRLLDDEKADLAFNVYKNSKLLTTVAGDKATDYLDKTGTATDTYAVKPASGKDKAVASPAVKVWSQGYLTIQMKQPEGAGYRPNDCSVGDLDGDGSYDIVVKWNARANDNSHAGITDNVYLDAYKLDGTQLWRINLGPNIRAGAHYTQYLVYDLDGDGRAEVACKTAPGTIDGKGKPVILNNDDPNANYVNERGHVLSGPEYLTVFDGRTGANLSTVPYYPQRGDDLRATWGDPNGNRSDRYLACVAYLDGKHPSIVMCRGYYTRAVLAAYDFKKGKLQQRWVYDSGTQRDPNTAFGQGNHSLAVADVDGDGCDEIIYGGAAIDNDGKLLYTTRLGHGDAHHLSDMDPDRPGLEYFQVHENRPSPAGVELRDARTGERLFGRPTNVDVGRGLAADIDPRYKGFEFWSSASDSVYNIKGEVISTRKPSVNFRIYWDGDVQDELLDGTRITKWNGDGVTPIVDFRTFGAASINGTKNNPNLSADLLGDWREEVLLYNREHPDQLMLFTTTIPTDVRMPTLMSDHVYRLGVVLQNVAYNQPPHLSKYIGGEATK